MNFAINPLIALGVLASTAATDAGNRIPMPRSNPSRITYIATAQPMIAAQMTGR
jgi:hypothetical protein